jgi:hypothetical protein
MEAGVQFRAVAVAPRRPGVRRALSVASLVAALLVAAVIKPWGSPPDPVERLPQGRPAPEQRLAGEASRQPTPTHRPGRPPSLALPPPRFVAPQPLPPRNLVLAALGTHDRWGVRVVLEGPRAGQADGDGVATGPVVERWAPVAPPLETGIRSLGSDSSDAVVFDVDDLQTRLIGITMPDAVTVADVRVSLVRPLGRRSRVEVLGMPDGQRGAFLFAPAPIDGRFSPWPAGTYLVSLEIDGVRTALTVALLADRRPA